jgi:iron complex outermembrane receptor protein
MKHQATHQRGSRSPLAVTISAVLAAATARAGDNPNALEEVVVTGIRHSIEQSIEIKRDSDLIVEAITAEDIGKLPDSSIAESIARLPGLTAQRDFVTGRAYAISVRGLGPDFAVTLMNGRELVSIGNNRGIEYDQYPSELISGVTVYKTPDAKLMGQGLSGTVDLQTIHPLSQANRTLALNVRGEKNSLGRVNPDVSDKGERASLIYVDQFADRTLGVALGFAHLNSPSVEEHFGAWSWDVNNFPGLAPSDPLNAAYGLQGAEAIATSSKDVRDGVLAVVEYQPNDSWHSTVDLYYSTFDQDHTYRSLMWESAPGWGDTTSLVNTTTTTIPGAGAPLINSGTIVGVQPTNQSGFNTSRDHIFAGGWNNEWKPGGDWTLISDLSYSVAQRRERTIETYSGLAPAGSGVFESIAFNIPSNLGVPTFTPAHDWTNPAIQFLTDSAAFGQDGFVRTPRVDDSLTTLKLAASRPLSSLFNSVDFGVNFSRRSKNRTDHDYQYFLSPTNPLAAVPIPANLLVGTTNLGFAGIPGVLAYNVPAALAQLYVPNTDQTQAYGYLRNYTVTEKVTTGFVQFGIKGHVGTVPVRGNVGLQLVHTDQHSTGTANNEPGQSQSGGAVYNDWLPSLNLDFDLSDLWSNLHVRAGLAKTMARARTDDMAAGAEAGIQKTGEFKGEWVGDGGNPALQPWRDVSYDLSVEKYFAHGNYVAIAGFYKKLASYIYTQQLQKDFTGFPSNTGVTVPDPKYGNIGIYSAPANGQGGGIQGIEFSGAFQGETLGKILDGFGLQASLSVTASSVLPLGPGSTQKVPGLSGQVYSGTFYYEKNGFSARLSHRFRGPFRAEQLGPHGNYISTDILPDRTTDAQASYDFESGPLKGLTVLLQVNNLRNSPIRTRYIGGIGSAGTDAPAEVDLYGRSILFGVNYKL